jgi:uncharacterized membrane protein (DUF2068 family)
VDWSLLACGRSGHTTYAPDEPELRAQLAARLPAGEAWQCLRCGAYVPGPPGASGPAAQAPFVPRGKQIRSHLILKLFAIERLLRVIIFGIASFFLWKYRHSQTSIEQAFNRELPVLRSVFRQLGFNIDHSKLVGLLRDALTLSSHAITLLAIGAAVYAVLELVEATGLWLARRWGEYFAMVATSLGLPLEIYDLSRHVTVTALVLFVVNLALVVYLAVTKRLFGIRGGKRAYDERLREESLLEAAADAAAQQSAAQPQAPPPLAPPAAANPGAPSAPADDASAAEEPAGTDSRRTAS